MKFDDRGSAGCWAKLLLACVCACLGTIPAWGASPSAPMEITTFHEFHTLSEEQAVKGTPIRIKGVVVCYDLGWNQLYIHDGAETGWLTPQFFRTNLQMGLEVEITGVTAFALGSPTMTNRHLQVLGHGPIPQPKRLEMQQLSSNLGQWIETRGWVRVADTTSGRLSLVLQDKGQTCLIYVMGPPSTNDFKSLIGCSVKIQGIDASETVEGRLEAASLFAPGLNAITVIERPNTKPSENPVITIDTLLGRELGSWTNDPVHLNGVITSFKPGESMVLKDATGSIRAQIIQTTVAQLDERVDLWGYLTVRQGETILRDAYFQGQSPTRAPPRLASESAAKPTPQGREITRISEITRMRPEEASQGFQVRLNGVVTYADPDWRNCFIQNRRGAIYVDLNQKDVMVGQWVEVTGQTNPGGFAPEVVNSHITVLGTTNLPPPVKADLEDLANGHLDSRWVQLEGVIRRVSEQWGHVTLTLMTPKGRFKAVVPSPSDKSLTNLIDALVSVQGACTSEINPRGQLIGVTLHVPGLDQISILEPVPADPFSIPATDIKSVATFDASRLAGRRVKISGSVTQVIPGKGFYVQDSSGGILVNHAQANELHMGDTVNILGFPSMGDFSPYLEEAAFVRTGIGSLPKPQVTTAEQILAQGKHDATLVKIEAHLVQRVPRSAHPKLVLQSGSIAFTATLETTPEVNKISTYRIGSLLQLVGVCSIQGGESHEPESFRLLVSRPQDITFVSSPPWWTVQHAFVLTGSLVLGMLLAWGWSRSLRRQVQAQTEVIRRNQEELLTVSRQAGMAEVATSVLHNVGNVLNSINVSATLAVDELRDSKTADVCLVADLMKEHAADLGHFITQDARGRHLPNYLAQLGQHLVEEKRSILNELASLTNNLAHVKDIVSMQQSFAKVGGITETVKVAALIEDALEMNAGGLERHKINISREYGTSQPLEITVDKHKVLQILINLISNAKCACAESKQPTKRLTIRLTQGDNLVKISVSDNGVGILSENLSFIFTYGFTTRKHGHGFGLHSAALAARDLGGTLLVQSEGQDKGATFSLELPLTPNKK